MRGACTCWRHPELALILQPLRERSCALLRRGRAAQPLLTSRRSGRSDETRPKTSAPRQGSAAPMRLKGREALIGAVFWLVFRPVFRPACHKG